ncbi:MAG: hypothetical protein HYS20_07770 [Rhodocyclales bacterium]|nr:hypothetical protein [Rhodocyclales bacterium]
MSSRAVRRAALAVLLPGLGGAWAQDPETSALMLADEAPAIVERASDWHLFVEGAGGGRRRDGTAEDHWRLSVDIRYDHSLTRDWRVFMADRLDLGWPAQGGGDTAINTLKEAYLSWRARPDVMLDLGRINTRHGVASGYNPTDWFRAGALRSVVSIDPASLKENRQGSVMLRGQRLWEGGSLTALYSPGLERHPDRNGLSLDLGATNPRARWLITLGQNIGGLTPQFLVYREQGMPPQFGLNLTALVNDATVAHIEWSGGRAPSLLAQALPPPAPARAPNTWRNHLAAGITHTTSTRISLSAEYHYNGAGLDKAAWTALRHGPPTAYWQYRARARTTQEPPTRHGLFVHATWQDALIPRLDLGLMHNLDLTDASRRTWVEARYHVANLEYAVQWQRTHGRQTSQFGALPESRGWQAVVRYYR